MSDPNADAGARDARLLSLLSRWQDLRAAGRDVSAAEVCADCPEMAPELERLARFEQGMRDLAAGNTTPPDQPVTLFAAEADVRPQAAGARYEVEGKLGEGGMGAVYRVRDRVLGRSVALKVVRPEGMTAALLARFREEARAVARLDHPHIVKVHDAGDWVPPGESAAVPCLTLELCEGGSLADRLETDRPDARESARLVALLARAMQHAHDRGIVHRDLKPANVLLAPPTGVAALDTPMGCPKITDFGLARQLNADHRLTRSGGGSMGTPEYMAPEQAEGSAEVGPKADVWALGVMLYRLLAGRVPFQSPSLTALMNRICHEEPPPLEGAPAALGRIVLACLEKDAANRPTAAELATRLEAWLLDGDTVARPGAAGRSEPRRKRNVVLQWSVLGCAGTLTATFGILMALLTWGLTASRRPGQPPPPPPPPESPRVKSLRVEAYRVDGTAARLLGEVSYDVGAKPLLTLPFGTHVITHVELTMPAYAYLIALNADGSEQLRWPVNAGTKRPDEDVEPPRVERIKDPDRLGLSGRPATFVLDDEPRGGLQGFAVVLSARPLPAYREWKQKRGAVPWRRTEAEGPYVADLKGTYPVLPGVGLVRGSEGELGKGPDLRPVCAAMQAGGAAWVEMLTVPVEAKP